MIIIGAILFGIAVFFAVGLATGKAPQIKLPKGKEKPGVPARQVWLTQAGIDLSPTQYYLGLGFIGLVTFALVSAVTQTPAVALAPTVGVVTVPHLFFANRRRKYLASTAAAWPDAIMELTASIEANASLHGALVAMSHRGPEALRPAFERFPTLASTVGVVPALEIVREKLSDPTSDRVIEVLILAHERGGGIVTDILRDLAAATTEDLQLQEEIESSQLEQKINARAVFVIPWIVLLLLVLSNEDFKEFYQSGFGLGVIIIGGVVSIIGIWLVGRLGRRQPEVRVFGSSAMSKTTDSALERELEGADS